MARVRSLSQDVCWARCRCVSPSLAPCRASWVQWSWRTLARNSRERVLPPMEKLPVWGFAKITFQGERLSLRPGNPCLTSPEGVIHPGSTQVKLGGTVQVNPNWHRRRKHTPDEHGAQATTMFRGVFIWGAPFWFPCFWVLLKCV